MFPSEPEDKLDPKDFPVQKDKLHETNVEELGPGACGLLLPAVPASAVFQPPEDRNSAENLHKENPRGKKHEYCQRLQHIKMNSQPRRIGR